MILSLRWEDQLQNFREEETQVGDTVDGNQKSGRLTS